MRVDAVFLRRLKHIVYLATRSSSTSESSSLLDESTAYSSRPKTTLLARMQTPPRLVALALTLATLAEILIYLSGTLISGIYPSLATRDAERFTSLILTVTLLYLLSSAMSVGKKYTAGCLAVVFRRNLTRVLHARYLKKNNLYNVTMLVSQSRTGTSQKPPRPASPISIAFTEEFASDDDEGDEHVRMLPSSTRESSSLMHDFAPTPVLDNPDQTIADDVNKLSEQLSTSLIQAITIPVLIVYYTYQTYNLTQTAIAPFLMYLFFLVTASVCRMAMNPIVPAVYAKEQREGDFRFNHVHVRTKAEAIAMMHSEFSEKKRLDTLLDVLVKVSYTVLRRNAPLNYCMRVTDYLGAVLSYLIISIPVFDGTFDDKTEAEITGLVSKNMFMCSILLESCDSLEEEERQKRASTAIEALNLSRPPLPRTRPPLLEVTHLICTINLENPPLPLSFTVSDGQHTFITGRSGVGKSSLLRILSGIWDPPSSTSPAPFHFHPSLLVNAITTPNNHHHEFHPSQILFLPQTTLLVPTTPAPTGTSSAHYHHSSNALTPLLTQIAYPLHPSETDLSNARAEQILSLVGLSHVVDRCYETIQDESSGSDGFVETLSGGEKQRLALARVLFWKPRIVFMDESLSALEEVGEVAMFKMLMGVGGITVVAISHSGSSKVTELFHQRVEMK
ncbi:hypothetical protein BCR33DRAFT_714312 [Rhizoclosmatium globosum]|uniref:ABC transporter domain-containing protein n=1 Tax=Rhizoclosmatium globosum TaxID=329046 RepID=A0A1Y2CNC9_9FUNG|nr:hypothetical protein BCR33DRAFT_714312 [Rhizoclosmatium globosum]|eukprot:ORY48548.1 hypothetical protein BCR33DRAFT_714312 [Rhizoclosmatium globosum]